MTNTVELRKEIKRSGLKLSYIAAEMHIHEESLRRKITNRSVFTVPEMTSLCDILNIDSLPRKQEIFFASNVD